MRVSDMDGIKFKKFKRGFIFGARHFPPSFLRWKNMYVHFDFENKFFVENFKYLKNEPNHQRDH